MTFPGMIDEPGSFSGIMSSESRREARTTEPDVVAIL